MRQPVPRAAVPGPTGGSPPSGFLLSAGYTHNQTSRTAREKKLTKISAACLLSGLLLPPCPRPPRGLDRRFFLLAVSSPPEEDSAPVVLSLTLSVSSSRSTPCIQEYHLQDYHLMTCVLPCHSSSGNKLVSRSLRKKKSFPKN